MSMDGFATPAGTQRFAQRHDGLAFNPLGRTGLWTSPAGFGSYRVNTDNEIQRNALNAALQSGLNLIDTSANYGDGGAELLIGQVLGQLVDRGELRRDEIILVSKAGYLQGQNLTLSQERKAAGNPFPDLVEYMPGLEHCIHPEFLADQLSRSLERLGVVTLDIYLLHNPEYYLSWAVKAGLPLPEARAEYYRRLGLAFTHLESEVAAGRIRGYGLSSNSLPHPADAADFTSLQEILDLVQSRGLENFHCIQLPANLLETGAFTEANQPGGLTVLQLAAATGIATLINRPLNAITADTLYRLASVPPMAAPDEAEVSTAVDRLAGLEAQFEAEILPGLLLGAQEKERVPALLVTGRILAQRWYDLGNWQQWQDIQATAFIPRLRAIAELLLQRRNLPTGAQAWLEQYAVQAETALSLVRRLYQAQGAEIAQKLQDAAQQADPAWEAPTLSQSALRALRSSIGVDCVLVGARQVAYVADVMRELFRPVAREERWGSWERLADSC